MTLRQEGSTRKTTKRPVADRFWEKVDKSGECWVWTRAKNRHGYGLFGLEGKSKLAHRVAYELEVGPVPEGLTLDHKCRTRACVRPEHLHPVTHRLNMQNVVAWTSSDTPRGVYHRESSGSYMVSVGTLRIGCYPNVHDAEIAAVAARTAIYRNNLQDRKTDAIVE